MSKPFRLLTLLFCYCQFLHAQNKEAFYKKAMDCYEKDDFQCAVGNINNALKFEPDNPEYLLLKGNSLEKLELYQEAYNTFSQSIVKNPKWSIAYSQRGLLLMRMRETEMAIKDFTNALAFERKDSLRLSLLLNRGAAFQNIREFEYAYTDFVNALKLDSLNIGTLNNLAAVCDEVGKGDQTMAYLQRIIQIDSTFIGAYVNIGFKLLGDGDYTNAIRYFNKVLELEPNEPLAYSNRAYCRYKLGDLKNAMSDINQSIRLYPGNSYAYRNRALIYIAMKELTNACKDLDEALTQGFTRAYGDEVEKLKKEHCGTGNTVAKN